ncbi:MAG: hypothetical protein ABFD54_15050 [Armatimonadota bacterium]|nr:hypothetical protein [bacterium]
MRHGTYMSENPTAVLAVAQAESALPFIVGCAPVHAVRGGGSVGEAVLLTSWAEVETNFGYVHDWRRYGLTEALYERFRKYGKGPVIAVNVFDPTQLNGEATTNAATLVNGTITLSLAGALVESVSADALGESNYIQGIDYNLSYTDAGYPIVTRLTGGDILSDTATVYVTYQTIPTPNCGVAASAVINALDLIDYSWVRFGKTPALIQCPGYSQIATVAAKMAAKGAGYGGGWEAFALIDVDTAVIGGANEHTEVAALKSANNLVSPYMDVLWPMCKYGGDVENASTVWSGELAECDAELAGIPYESASNRSVMITGVCTIDGTEIFLTDEQATETLNSNGVTTFINNGPRGWIAWGNRTGAYPGNTDPKDMWRPYRRMLIFAKNTVRRLLLQMVDRPGNVRQIEAVINTINIWINSLISKGAVMPGSRIEFLRENNAETALANGEYNYTITLAFPTPMEAITVTFQVDTSLLNSIFDQLAQGA